MINYNKINDIINEQWVNSLGRGNICLYPPLSPIACIYPTIIKYLDYQEGRQCLIVLNDYNYKDTITQHFKQNLGVKKAESYLSKIKMLTVKYATSVYDKYELVILLGVENYFFIRSCCNTNRYILNVIINPKLALEAYNYINSFLPLLRVNVSAEEIIKAKIQSPIEEHRIKIELDADSAERYKKQSDYIADSMKIFGNLETVTACRIGNSELGISAVAYRRQLAEYNGWSETLDKSVEINKRIDALFSPLAIEERANNVFNISRLRRDLIENYPAKLNAVLSIIKNNPDKKIIIVSKSGNFANDIAQHINKISSTNSCFCGQYHNEIPKSYIIDTVTGKPITYKTGENKGKEKLFGSAALSNYYLDLYNANFINILSIKSASDNSLSCKCDIAIFTSTLLPNIFEFKTRYTNIDFPNENTIIYRLYCKDTIEESVFYKEEQSNLITICDEPQSDSVKINENTGEIIL